MSDLLIRLLIGALVIFIVEKVLAILTIDANAKSILTIITIILVVIYIIFGATLIHIK